MIFATLLARLAQWRPAPYTRRLSGPALLVAGVSAMVAPGAQAGEVYANVGAPGLMVGYAQRMSERVSLRVDVATIGSINRDGKEQGIDYKGVLKSNRLGIFGDWFMTSGFRLTGGITFNDMSLRMKASGVGQSIKLGSTTTVMDATDQLNIDVAFPRVMPYLGFGYGHHRTDGVGFVFDAGVSLGRPSVTESHTGNHLGQVSQADVDSELSQLRASMAKLRFVPQLSVGVSANY